MSAGNTAMTSAACVSSISRVCFTVTSRSSTDEKRKVLREQIERDAVAWSVGIVTPEEIDRINILNASILAKTYRDDYMDALAEEYPQYDWKGNKGYPTRKHRAAIKEYGTTPYHRLTFNLLGSGELSLPFAEE